VNNLLSSSAATLQALQGAVSEVFNCTNLSSAVRQIQNVVNQRSTEYKQASALSTSALANGAAVKSDLIAALRNSLDADKDFLTWAQQQLSPGCTPTTQSSAYNAAYNASQQAGASKKAFIQVWDLANGAAVKSDLIAALRNSLDADKDFLTWAQQQLNPGCSPSAQSSAYNAAYNASQQAGASKKAFVQVWDLVAAQYGIQQKSPGAF